MTELRPTLIRHSDAEVLDSSGVTLLADTPVTGGVVTSHRSTFRSGRPGAPPHLHREASELFYVLGGSLTVLLGESLTTLATGDFLLVPPRLPHAFEAAGSGDADVFFVLTQAKPRFDYYRCWSASIAVKWIPPSSPRLRRPMTTTTSTARPGPTGLVVRTPADACPTARNRHSGVGHVLGDDPFVELLARHLAGGEGRFAQ